MRSLHVYHRCSQRTCSEDCAVSQLALGESSGSWAASVETEFQSFSRCVDTVTMILCSSTIYSTHPYRIYSHHFIDLTLTTLSSLTVRKQIIILNSDIVVPLSCHARWGPGLFEMCSSW